MIRALSPINIAFYLVITDALLNYFLQTFYRPLQVLAVVPIFLVAHVMINNSSVKWIKQNQIILIILGIIGYTLAYVTASETTPSKRILEIISAFTAWFVGYFWLFHNSSDAKEKWRGILLLTLLHIMVCMVAILKFAPAYFPTYDNIWSFKGVLINRPSVTTDQNFQIFYFIPVAAFFCFFRSKAVFLFSAVGLLAAAYVLATLQTRSGILVLTFSCLFAVLVQFFSGGKMKLRALIISIFLILLGFGVILYKAEYIYGMILRFTEEGFETAFGRLHGFLYFFEKVINPLWWVPRGYSEYFVISGSGNVPHSNITAHLLDGGILGVICWFGLIVIPVVKLGWLLFLKIFERDAAIVCTIAVGSLVAQLSLNVPFVDQTWLWGGVTCASLRIFKANYASRRKTS